MESEKQAETKASPRRYPIWKYLWRIVLGELVLLSLEYFFIKPPTSESWPNNTIYICLGFLFINLLVALIIVFIPAWEGPKSLKIVTLALGSCLLPLLPWVLQIYYFLNLKYPAINFYGPGDIHIIRVGNLIWLLIILSILPLVLSIIGLIWVNEENRRGNLLNPKAGEATSLCQIALAVSLIIIISQCCMFAVLMVGSI